MPLPAHLVTGDALLDEQHADIFARVQRMRRAVTEERATPEYLRVYLARLVDLLVEHFRHEERLMEAVGYPSRRTHAAEHVALWRSALALTEDCEADGYGAVSVGRVGVFLTAVQEHHIERHDCALARCLRWRNFGEPDAVA